MIKLTLIFFTTLILYFSTSPLVLAQNQTQEEVNRLYELEIPESCQVVQVTWASYRRRLRPAGTTIAGLVNEGLFGPVLAPVLSPYFNTEPYHYDVMLRIQCANGTVYLVLLGWGLQNLEEWEYMVQSDWQIMEVGMLDPRRLLEILDKISDLQESHPPRDYCVAPFPGTWNCQSLTKAIVNELNSNPARN